MPKVLVASRTRSSDKIRKPELTVEPWSAGSGPHALTWFPVVSGTGEGCPTPACVGPLASIPQLPPHRECLSSFSLHLTATHSGRKDVASPLGPGIATGTAPLRLSPAQPDHSLTTACFGPFPFPSPQFHSVKAPS